MAFTKPQVLRGSFSNGRIIQFCAPAMLVQVIRTSSEPQQDIDRPTIEQVISSYHLSVIFKIPQ